MPSVSSNWSDELDKWSDHGSGGGLDTIKTAATTFITAVAANLPAGADSAQRDIEVKLLGLMSAVGNEFRP